MRGDSVQTAVGKLVGESAPDVMPKRNVIGMGRSTKVSEGQDTGKECITVFVRKGSKAEDINAEDMIPDKILEVPTDVEEIEEAEPMVAPYAKQHPYMGGDEIGIRGLPQSGTLGMIFRAKVLVDGQPEFMDFALTNYHVVHYRGQDPDPRGNIITQPTYKDNSTNRHNIGRPYRYVPLKSNNYKNLCDAAIVRLRPDNKRPNWDEMYDRMYTSGYFAAQGADPIGFPHYHEAYNGRIRWQRSSEWAPETNAKSRSIPRGLGHVEKGDTVFKHGRTTKLTRGFVKATNYVTYIRYWPGLPDPDEVNSVLFMDQLLCAQGIRNGDEEFNGEHGIVRGGDSGSVVLDDENHVVGLLFAGASSGAYAIASPIQTVFKELFTEEELRMVDLDTEIDEGPGT